MQGIERSYLLKRHPQCRSPLILMLSLVVKLVLFSKDYAAGIGVRTIFRIIPYQLHIFVDRLVLFVSTTIRLIVLPKDAAQPLFFPSALTPLSTGAGTGAGRHTT